MVELGGSDEMRKAVRATISSDTPSCQFWLFCVSQRALH